MVSALAHDEASRRAARLRLVLTDVDGTLTDGSVYCGPLGEALLRFDRRDGMGVERLRDAGIEIGIVTREASPIVRRRAEKLAIDCYFEGIRNKARVLSRCIGRGHAAAEVAFIGDDVNDLELLRLVGETGLTGAPSSAHASVLRVAHFRCGVPGGRGAFREFADWILSLRTKETAR